VDDELVAIPPAPLVDVDVGGAPPSPPPLDEVVEAEVEVESLPVVEPSLPPQATTSALASSNHRGLRDDATSTVLRLHAIGVASATVSFDFAGLTRVVDVRAAERGVCRRAS
jgi:hypothetical protein